MMYSMLVLRNTLLVESRCVGICPLSTRKPETCLAGLCNTNHVFSLIVDCFLHTIGRHIYGVTLTKEEHGVKKKHLEGLELWILRMQIYVKHGSITWNTSIMEDPLYYLAIRKDHFSYCVYFKRK